MGLFYFDEERRKTNYCLSYFRKDFLRFNQRMNSSLSAAFYSSIFSQIEEIGWEHLIKAEENLSTLTFRILDEKIRSHLLEITLPEKFPDVAPSISADLPYMPKIEWSKESRLIEILNQFHKHLGKLQDFWSTIECIDNNLCIINPKESSCSTTKRHISLGDDCSILICINQHKPNSLPECRFFGPDQKVDKLLKSWKRNSKKWKNETEFNKNLTKILEIELPQPISINPQEEEETLDCGICYAQHLPIDDEFGENSGGAPNYTCENPNCKRAFHTVCLKDWLRTITTTRQSFDVLFGNCPYCSEPVAVKTNE